MGGAREPATHLAPRQYSRRAPPERANLVRKLARPLPTIGAPPWTGAPTQRLVTRAPVRKPASFITNDQAPSRTGAATQRQVNARALSANQPRSLLKTRPHPEQAGCARARRPTRLRRSAR